MKAKTKRKAAESLLCICLVGCRLVRTGSDWNYDGAIESAPACVTGRVAPGAGTRARIGTRGSGAPKLVLERQEAIYVALPNIIAASRKPRRYIIPLLARDVGQRGKYRERRMRSTEEGGVDVAKEGVDQTRVGNLAGEVQVPPSRTGANYRDRSANIEQEERKSSREAAWPARNDQVGRGKRSVRLEGGGGKHDRSHEIQGPGEKTRKINKVEKVRKSARDPAHSSLRFQRRGCVPVVPPSTRTGLCSSHSLLPHDPFGSPDSHLSIFLFMKEGDRHEDGDGGLGGSVKQARYSTQKSIFLFDEGGLHMERGKDGQEECVGEAAFERVMAYTNAGGVRTREREDTQGKPQLNSPNPFYWLQRSSRVELPENRSRVRRRECGRRNQATETRREREDASIRVRGIDTELEQSWNSNSDPETMVVFPNCNGAGCSGSWKPGTGARKETRGSGAPKLALERQEAIYVALPNIIAASPKTPTFAAQRKQKRDRNA
ncbi:hypothetical protein C8R43DRAFT_945199 [Mycena crocata]|nr:hypothetical protein C8R43DRAFT_945199 [Mycena crocata]